MILQIILYVHTSGTPVPHDKITTLNIGAAWTLVRLPLIFKWGKYLKECFYLRKKQTYIKNI